MGAFQTSYRPVFTGELVSSTPFNWKACCSMETEIVPDEDYRLETSLSIRSSSVASQIPRAGSGLLKVKT
jgi:hypothetical protein